MPFNPIIKPKYVRFLVFLTPLTAFEILIPNFQDMFLVTSSQHWPTLVLIKIFLNFCWIFEFFDLLFNYIIKSLYIKVLVFLTHPITLEVLIPNFHGKFFMAESQNWLTVEMIEFFLNFCLANFKQIFGLPLTILWILL